VIACNLQWTRVRLPLTSPFRTSVRELFWRESWVVQLEAEGGIVGTGEAAPLLGHGLPEGPSVEALLGRLRDSLPTALDALSLPSGATASEAAVRFAVETAALDAFGQAIAVPLAGLLGPHRDRVEVNAVIGVANAADAAARAAEAAQAGFRTVKLKVGGRPLAEDVERVAAVRHALGPAVHLRLDANGAWTEPDALAALAALRPYDLELVEQPVPAGEPAALRRVREKSGVRIAADEDVVSRAAVEALLAARAVDAVVLKPMMLGGLAVSLDIAQRAAAEGVASFVTTTVESGVGTAAALHLSAALPGAAPACGLATTSLLHSDLLREPLLIRGGAMALPPRPGLGVVLDPAAVARFAWQEQAA
jgi:o-succinylbenzoate synthase